MKAIILAGGKGTRLAPLTAATSKQLLPVYDKPLIFFPLSIPMLAGIKEILIISTPKDTARIETLLGDGGHLGIQISYAIQYEPTGIPSAFDIGRKFIGDENIMLVLGDNVFYGNDLSKKLQTAIDDLTDCGGAEIFAYHVRNPSDYGVAVLNNKEQVVKMVEKPKEFISPYAITGLYLFDNSVIDRARKLKPSARGETEIIDVLSSFHLEGRLRATTLNKGFYWQDCGSHEALFSASNFVKLVQESQNTSIACLEEIAYSMGYISAKALKQQAEKMGSSSYGLYLKSLI